MSAHLTLAAPALILHPVYGLDLAEAAAVIRALRQGAQLRREEEGDLYEATRPGSPSTYVTTVHRCSCPAGAHGRPCKHRSLLVLLEAILDSRPRGP